MRKHVFAICLLSVLFLMSAMQILYAQEADTPPISSKSKACVACHSNYTPGMVADWEFSRHANTTPERALQKPIMERRISAESVPEELAQTTVGCYECHGRNTDQHADSFDHMGTKINVIVSPKDCETCHPVEVEQYSDSKKAHAYKNLLANPVYHALVNTITGVKILEDGVLSALEPDEQTLNDTCLGCHGTDIRVDGMKTSETKMGKVQVPHLVNWPSQGVGRQNPDGSIGSCTSCHTRHAFSIAEARDPHTCAQCHGEPDVPAWPVYEVSKHGNIYAARHPEWDFEAVPWKVGEDFTAPTCATCHNSLLSTPKGEVLVERNHDFGARLWVRVFGLIYSHPQPKSGNTSTIVNADGLPLPTTFGGVPSSEHLIDASEQLKRLTELKKVCTSCHSTSWTDQHFARFDHTVANVDKMVAAATGVMASAWEKQLEDNMNPFDEGIEQMWIKQWLFYANTVRYASAMTGAHKYTAFTDGWWELTNNFQEMQDRISAKE